MFSKVFLRNFVLQQKSVLLISLIMTQLLKVACMSIMLLKDKIRCVRYLPVSEAIQDYFVCDVHYDFVVVM